MSIVAIGWLFVLLGLLATIILHVPEEWPKRSKNVIRRTGRYRDG